MNGGRYAVVDDPDGVQWIVAPKSADQARALKRKHSRFWCSTRAGGCGARLSLKSGDKRAVHLAHFPGEGDECPYRWDDAQEHHGYLHLILQLALQRWLQTQGHASTLEKVLDSGGRADLHISVDDFAQTIEVQLSPIEPGNWRSRTYRYLRSVSAVSWLFGTQVSRPAVDAAIDRSGFALRIRLNEPEDSTAVSWERIDLIEIGTQIPGGTEWTPLADCTVTPSGVSTPHVAAAIEKHHDRANAREGARRIQDGTSLGAPSPTSGPSLRADTTTVPPATTISAPTATRPTPTRRTTAISRVSRPPTAFRRPLSEHRHLDVPDAHADYWTDLPPELRYPAAVMAHLVTHIEAGWTVGSLSFPDVEDGTDIRDALVSRGLIEIYLGPCGTTRWRRGGRASEGP